MIWVKALLNLFFFCAGLAQIDGAAEDNIREMPKSWVSVEYLIGYIIMAIGFSVWFW